MSCLFNIIAVGFYDSEDSISTVQTLQDCGLSVPFMSQWGLSKDLSSCTSLLIRKGVDIQMLGCGNIIE